MLYYSFPIIKRNILSQGQSLPDTSSHHCIHYRLPPQLPLCIMMTQTFFKATAVYYNYLWISDHSLPRIIHPHYDLFIYYNYTYLVKEALLTSINQIYFTFEKCLLISDSGSQDNINPLIYTKRHAWIYMSFTFMMTSEKCS